MVKMHGSSRVLDSAITETGTSAARQIALYGITSLSELTNKPLLVKSNNDGVANTTIQINSLTATILKVMKNNVIIDTYANWITTNQLYFLMYNGSVFIAFPIGISSTEGSSNVFNIPIAVADLPNNATTAQMLTAFGSIQNQSALQSTIESGNSMITFEDESNPVHRLYLIETKFNSTNNTDTMVFIKEENSRYIIVKQVYTRDTTEPTSTPYTSVVVNKFNIDNAEIDITEYAPKISTKTILTSQWVLNSSTNNYEYTITDSSVTVNHLVEISMDLANQAKMTDGYTESYAGGYKIITSTQPTSSVTMTIKIQKTIS